MAVEALARAPYASDPARSRGRLHPEPASADPQRVPPRLRPHHPFDRVPPARAQDPGVRVPRGRPFPHPADPHAWKSPRSPARSPARCGLDEDLAEASALGHDLGHPPFGHAGERALDDCLRGFGGFDHNAQTLRVVTALERRYADFDGLNLTWETLEGLVKHNGPLTDRAGAAGGRYAERGLPRAIAEYSRAVTISNCGAIRAPRRRPAPSPTTSPTTPTTSTTGCAPSCSRSTISPRCRWSATSCARSRAQHPRIEPARRVHELVRRLITRMIEDVIAETPRARSPSSSPRRADDVRAAGAAGGRRSRRDGGGRPRDQGFPLSADVPPRAYHADHGRRRARGARPVRALRRTARATCRRNGAHGLDPADEAGRALRIADFIAGMTDRYAMVEHARLFGSTPELR